MTLPLTWTPGGNHLRKREVLIRKQSQTESEGNEKKKKTTHKQQALKRQKMSNNSHETCSFPHISGPLNHPRLIILTAQYRSNSRRKILLRRIINSSDSDSTLPGNTALGTRIQYQGLKRYDQSLRTVRETI